MSSEKLAGELTELIARASTGDKGAEAKFCQIVYDEVRALARRLKGSGDRGSVNSTMLVNEFFMKLLNANALGDMRNRRYFFAVAADQMRKILVDHARRKRALKRGGHQRIASLDEALDQLVDNIQQDYNLEIDALERALEKLQKHNPRQHEVVSLRFFGGRTVPEVAELLGVSVGTVERDWRLARAKLWRDLKDD